MGINLYLSPFENYTFYIAIFFIQINKRDHCGFFLKVKFIYSEKATNFCEIFKVDYFVMVKSTVEISQNFVAFSE